LYHKIGYAARPVGCPEEAAESASRVALRPHRDFSGLQAVVSRQKNIA
jgi:hypothetical protein